MLAALGVGVATFWHTNPWLIPLALAPLILINRSLSVPALQMEARVDPKTGLFNARHFAAALAEELTRAQRFDRPLSLIMADLDLLRDINNNYGHLAGDAVLRGIADVFRQELRHYDVPARFGGEEFSILLPETTPDQALEIAERIRRALADARFEVETSSEPIQATVSIGIAAFPDDGRGANELIHQADLAVYRAKLQGRNRVLAASAESSLLASVRSPQRLAAVPHEVEPFVPAPGVTPAAGVDRSPVNSPEPASPIPVHTTREPRFFSLSYRLRALIALVGTLGVGAGVAGIMLGTSRDLIGLLVVAALVGGGQALALEVDEGAISFSAVGRARRRGTLRPRAGLVLAIAIVAVDWSARGVRLQHVLFNLGALTLASLSAAGRVCGGRSPPDRRRRSRPDRRRRVLRRQHGALFARDRGRGNESWRNAFQERFAWLLPHYVVYGFIGGVMAIAYDAAGLYALAVFTVPLLLMRKTQESYLAHTRKSAAQAPRGRRDDPGAERLARAGEPTAQGAFHRGNGVPLGHRRRARLLHRRSFASGSAARPRDR